MFHVEEEDEEYEEIFEAKEDRTVPWRKRIPGGYRITYVMDSGAGASVAPASIAPDVQVTATRRSDAGEVFLSACNGEMPN